MSDHKSLTALLAASAVAGACCLVAANATAVGICREVGCGSSAAAPTSREKCERAALEEAKQDYERFLGVYKDQSEIADRMWEQMNDTYREADGNSKGLSRSENLAL